MKSLSQSLQLLLVETMQKLHNEGYCLLCAWKVTLSASATLAIYENTWSEKVGCIGDAVCWLSCFGNTAELQASRTIHHSHPSQIGHHHPANHKPRYVGATTSECWKVSQCLSRSQERQALTLRTSQNALLVAPASELAKSLKKMLKGQKLSFDDCHQTYLRTSSNPPSIGGCLGRTGMSLCRASWQKGECDHCHVPPQKLH